MAEKRKRTPKELTVTAATQLTQNMRRITLHGEDLANFPDDAVGAYIKLMFDATDSDRPIMRTYTVAQYRAADNEIDVDFMLHTGADGTGHGIAAPWSINAQVGDKLSIFGPGPAKYINPEARSFLLAADMTALPALTANLALLPEDARGHIVIEILSRQDVQDLPIPPNMELIWVENAHAGSDESPLYHAIAALDWPDVSVAVWIACEFKTMKKIRRYLKEEVAVEKSHLYISSYWKQGLNEEQHKVVKREDSD